MTSLWKICRDKLLSVPIAQAQEQSSARTFCLKYSGQQIAQSVLGCQQHQLMCCPGPDSCSGHRVIRYEHHFTILNMHLPSCNPRSQSIPILVSKQLQLNIFSVSLTLLLYNEQKHTRGTNPTPYRKPAVCPNTATAGQYSWPCCQNHPWLHPSVLGHSAQRKWDATQGNRHSLKSWGVCDERG